MSDLRKLELPPQGLNTLFGVQDQNIKYLETLLDVSIGARGNELLIDGDPRDIETVEQILREFGDLFDEGQHFTDKELRNAFKQIAEDRVYSLKDYFLKARFNPAGKKQVAPKTANQRKYLDAFANNDLVFGIGVAGTGKSYEHRSLLNRQHQYRPLRLSGHDHSRQEPHKDHDHYRLFCNLIDGTNY